MGKTSNLIKSMYTNKCKSKTGNKSAEFLSQERGVREGTYRTMLTKHTHSTHTGHGDGLLNDIMAPYRAGSVYTLQQQHS